MKKKTRIIKRTSPTGKILFTIQQKHFIFRWWWVDAWINSLYGAMCIDSYSSLKEAEENLYRFDGSVTKEEAIKQ